MKTEQGLTLIELLIYIAILALVGLMGTSLFLNVSRSYFLEQARNEVTQNLRVTTQNLQQAIRASTQVNSASSSALSLAVADPTKNPVVFTLLGTTLYRQDGSGSQVALTSNKVDVTSLNFYSVNTQQTTLDPVYHWAWNGGGSASQAGGIGWIDFNPALGNVQVPLGKGDFYGYLYAPSISGYISLNCQTTASCGTVPYKVTSDSNGTASGWAWSDLYGWWSFNATDTSSTIPYGVTINQTTGDFSGWAWSENLGWLSVNCNNSGIGNTCGTSNYKVKAVPLLGRSLNAVRVVITVAYHAPGNALLQYSDSYDFSVALGQPSNVSINNVTPAAGSGVVSPSINGGGFQSGATAKLSRVGQLDILPTSPCSVIGTTSMNCTFDTTGKAKGNWDVWIIDPDGEIGVLPQGFQIQ